YMRIYLLGMPAILLCNAEAAILRAQGDSRSPLICLTIAGALNVLLNLAFVLCLGMDVDGVALATLISNLAGAALLFFVLLRGHSIVCFRWHRMLFDMSLFRRIVYIGLPTGMQSAMFSLSNIVIQEAINSLGSDVIAASAAAFNIEIIVYFVVSGFGQACTTFVGQNYGAGRLERCRRVLWTGMWQTMAIAVAVSCALLASGKYLLAWFNADPSVIAYGYIRLEYILWFEAIAVVIEILSGVMRGFGHSLEPAVIALLGVCGLRIIWVCTVFRTWPTFSSLMACYPVSWAAVALASAFACHKLLRRLQSEAERKS
ncbi:MAG: MATE family efflux transporter, partial [Mailhella sp.]|nr:MATE family efflux transporter [Mailhella sp.]